MKNKVLPILLVLPFVVGVLSIVALQFTVNTLNEDITDIAWNYRQNEAFQQGTKTKLMAQGVGSPEAVKDPLNAIVWSVSQSEEETTPFASIEVLEGNYYLNSLEIGKVTLTASNYRGTLSRSFNAFIYEDGVILINTLNNSSLGLEKEHYYGEFDYHNNQDVKATFALEVQAYPDDLNREVEIIAQSPNVSYSNGLVRVERVHEKIEANYFTFGVKTLASYNQTFSFNTVKDGVNIYDYASLLKATESSKPRIIVQQKHFESLDNAFDEKGNLLRDDTVLFGNYDFKNKEFNFKNEVKYFKTTYSSKFIEDWNLQKSDKLDNRIITGLHIKKDFYGNGFKLNGHNLTYPYATTTNSDGVKIATLNAKNLFRGPLPFVGLGNMSKTPLITAYGQDNALLYVDGDNLTLRDLNVRNADFGNNFNNLKYTGTAIEINGDNVQIVNSQIKNARNTIRVFNGKNLVIKNSFISTALQFLLSIGSNKYETPRPDAYGTLYDEQGNLISEANSRFSIYFRYPDKPLSLSQLQDAGSLKGDYADGLLSKYLMTPGDEEGGLEKALNSLNKLMNQEALIQDENGLDIYQNDITIEDSHFHQSGIASIGLETMFNGPFLYNGLPSAVTSNIQKQLEGIDLNKIGGVSYPSKLKLVGDTSFFDYKKTDSIDVNQLIGQNITTVLNEMGVEGFDFNLTVDDIFPIRSLLESTAIEHKYDIKEAIEEEIIHHLNVPIIYYGGGLNKSIVDTSELNENMKISAKTELNLLNYLINNKTGDDLIATIAQRLVLTAIGFSPFHYHAYTEKYLYQINPNIDILKARSKGGLN